MHDPYFNQRHGLGPLGHLPPPPPASHYTFTLYVLHHRRFLLQFLFIHSHTHAHTHLNLSERRAFPSPGSHINPVYFSALFKRVMRTKDGEQIQPHKCGEHRPERGGGAAGVNGFHSRGQTIAANGAEREQPNQHTICVQHIFSFTF